MMQPDEAQHDNHCWMTANGRNWVIEKAEPGMLHLRSDDGLIRLEHTAINWDIYCEAAAQWMHEAYGL